jgi:ankyrin repeat protein
MHEVLNILLTIASNDHDSMLQQLLHYSAIFGEAVFLSNCSLISPLQLAAAQGNDVIIQFLLDYARPDTVSTLQHSPICIAARYGHKIVMEKLLQSKYVSRAACETVFEIAC